MPFSLNPSGYCCHFDSNSIQNLKPGEKCPLCKRVAGHALGCPRYKEPTAISSRPKLFNAAAVLWAKSPHTNFLTFTLPSSHPSLKVYQLSPHCTGTGDLVVSSAFSKTLEAFATRCKRKGSRFCYAWVAEAQMERQEKFGGIGDLHFHLVTNQRIKSGRKVVDLETLEWLQSIWCGHIQVSSNNCLDVKDIPHGVNSIPAYFAKYMGKGSQRPIYCRRFFSSRDLSCFSPIQLNELPYDCELIREVVREFDGVKVTYQYYDSRQVLELYGHYMRDQHSVTTQRKEFTGEELELRRQVLQTDLSHRIAFEGDPDLYRALSGTKSPPEA